MNENQSQPAAWLWATFGTLAENTTNGFGKRRSETGSPCIVLRLADIIEGRVYLDGPRRINCSTNEIERYRLKPDDLLVIRVNGSPDLVGRFISFAQNPEPVLFCDHFIRVRFHLPEMAHFIRYFGDARNVRRFIEEHKVCSAGQNTVSQGVLEKLLVPVPPLNEQRRIVAKIEELFSDLDAGIVALERVRANLKRYRAAVLKAAVEGKLTEDWRAKHPDTEPASVLLERILTERRRQWEKDQLAKFAQAGKQPPKGWENKYQEPPFPEPQGEAELPTGWCFASVSQVSHYAKYGSSAKTSGATNGVPVLRMGNIQDGRLDLSDLKYLPEDHDEFPDLLLRKGDLLFNRTNSAELVGKSAVYEGDPSPCSFASYLISVRAVKGSDPRSLCFYLNSVYGKGWIASVVSQQVGQANVNGTKLQALTFPLASEAEQAEIVQEVERRFSILDEIETQVDANLKRAARLRQGILKRAFEGRLLPQDPTDEPAEKLLERIRQQRQPATTMYNGRMGTRHARRPRRTSDPVLPFPQDDGSGQGGKP
ncbi:MAG: restriction endonuclease subunit S [Isosphaeraceae bacterium]